MSVKGIETVVSLVAKLLTPIVRRIADPEVQRKALENHIVKRMLKARESGERYIRKNNELLAYTENLLEDHVREHMDAKSFKELKHDFRKMKHQLNTEEEYFFKVNN